MFKRKKIFFFLFLVLLFFPVFLVTGNEENDIKELEVDWPTTPLPIEGEYITPEAGMELHEMIAYLYSWGVGIAGIIAFGVLIFAGVKYMTSTGDPQKIQEAMQRISSALIGLILLLSSFLILNIINPEMTKITPIENLLHEKELATLGVAPAGPEEPPCEFVITFSQEEFEGKESLKYVKSRSRPTEDIGSMKGYRKMTDHEVTEYRTDKVNDIVKEIEEVSEEEEKDINKILGEIEEIRSEIKTFEDLEEFFDHAEEKEYFSEADIENWKKISRDPDFPSHSPEGRDIYIKNDKHYIQGGSCLVTPYEASAMLWGRDRCGNDLGTIHVSPGGVKDQDQINRSVHPEYDIEDDVDCLYIENIGEGEASEHYRPSLVDAYGEWECADDDPCGEDIDGIKFEDDKERAKNICDPEELKDPENPEEQCEEGELWCCPPDVPECGKDLPWEEVHKMNDPWTYTAFEDKLITIHHPETGRSWRAYRGGGSNHMDVEPKTEEDMLQMAQVYDLDTYQGITKEDCSAMNLWRREAVVVEIDGTFVAGSINGCPHGFQQIPIHFPELGNNHFDGHHCIHFRGSKGHGSGTECPLHQDRVREVTCD